VRQAYVFSFLILAATGLQGAASPVWQTDWKAAFRLAKEQHRLVFVDYYAPTCEICHDIETMSFKKPEVMERLSDFVLLKVEIVRNEVPQAHREYNPPVYIVFDPDQRERFRIDDKNLGALYPKGWGWKDTGDSEVFDRFRAAAPAFLRAAELLDAKQDLEGSFLVASTYSRIKLWRQARAAYADVKRIAEQRKDTETAQLAEVQSAFTFAPEGNPSRAIDLLKVLRQSPASRDDEAIIWLTLGHAYEIAKDLPSAADAFRHAEAAATPGSRTYSEATLALAKVQG